MDTRALVRVALFAAIIASLGLLPKFDLPLAGGVPITAQTLGVMLAGALLGPRQGPLAVLLFLFVVILGAPLLAGGRGGLGVLFGPSVGFLIGWVPGAFLTGLVVRALARFGAFASATAASIVGGIIAIYVCGVPVLAYKTNMTLWQALLGSAGFLPGDLLKAIATGFIAQAAHRIGLQPAPSRA